MNNHIQLVLKSSTTELSLNDRDLGIYIVPELEGLTGLPEIRTTSGVNAGYDGGWTSAQNYDARSITIRGVIANTDVATVERLRRQLTALAGQGKKEELTLNLVTEAGNAYTLQVRTIALEMALQKVVYQQEFLLQLRADDPLIYDASETGHEALLQVAQATGGFTIDFNLPLAITGSSEETVVNNDGLEQVPTITRMYGSLHNPKIINQTTNQFMQIEADLGFAEGEWIEPSDTITDTNITVNGAPEGAPFADLEIEGNTSQDGTPTPSAPVAVQTVTGENVVKICGKNLFDKSKATLGYRISGDGAPYADSPYFISDFIPVKANTAYRINTANVGGSSAIATYDKDKVFIRRILGDRYQNIVTDANALYIRFATLQTVIDQAQLELGSTATDFEPYQEQSYEINLGKNLFDKDNASEVINAYIDTSAHKITTGNNQRLAYIECEPNTTYTISKTLSARFIIATTSDTPANNVSVSQDIAKNTDTTYTITTNSTAKYLCVFCYHASYDTLTPEQILSTLQIEKGSTATSYAPYFTPIELCKIGTYQDYIWKDGDTWKVHKAIGKVDLSTCTWYTVVQPGILRGTTSIQNVKYVSSNQQVGSAVAEKYIIHKGAGMSAADLAGYFAIDTAQVSVNTGDASINPTGNIYYALATPTDTEITNEALVGQLEALAAATMYNPQTNITTLYADGNEQPTLDVSYFTDKNPDTRDELVIDSRLRTITLNGLDVYHLQAPGSEFLMLAPGENRLALQSDITGDNGYAQVSYKQGYLSI